MTDQPNLQTILHQLKLGISLSGKAPYPVFDDTVVGHAFNEAIDAIYAAGLSAIGDDEPDTREDGEIMRDPVMRNRLRAEQRKAWQRVCYGDTSHE